MKIFSDCSFFDVLALRAGGFGCSDSIVDAVSFFSSSYTVYGGSSSSKAGRFSPFNLANKYSMSLAEVRAPSSFFHYSNFDCISSLDV